MTSILTVSEKLATLRPVSEIFVEKVKACDYSDAIVLNNIVAPRIIL